VYIQTPGGRRERPEISLDAYALCVAETYFPRAAARECFVQSGSEAGARLVVRARVEGCVAGTFWPLHRDCVRSLREKGYARYEPSPLPHSERLVVTADGREALERWLAECELFAARECGYALASFYPYHRRAFNAQEPGWVWRSVEKRWCHAHVFLSEAQLYACCFAEGLLSFFSTVRVRCGQWRGQRYLYEVP
jgi:hypothetical protein